MGRKSKILNNWPAIVFILVILFSTPAFPKYSGGSGEPNNPYQIADVNDLLTLSADINDYNKCFIMTADINLDPNILDRGVFISAVIAPDINNSNNYFDGNSFIGIFDGADYKILNLTIDTNGIGNDYLGLFGDVNTGGEVKNLGLENIDIKSSPVSYSFCLGGLAGSNEGSINNCHSTGNLNGYSSDVVGGLVGFNFYGNIENCYSTSNVNVSQVGLMLNCSVGGLSGYCLYSTINNSFATGNVIANGGSVGGVRIYAGGLTGYNYNASNSNCYATGNVSVTGPKYNYAGGLVGVNAGDSNIVNCYASGSVESLGGAHFAGGLVGINSGDINNSYFLAPSDGGGPDNGYGIPLTDGQMKHQASFVGWDFVWETINGPNDIWAICEDVNYPKLAWQYVVGDSDNDKDVDFVDFAPLGNKWRQADSHLYCGGSDLTGDGLVNLDDLDAFVENWLQ